MAQVSEREQKNIMATMQSYIDSYNEQYRSWEKNLSDSEWSCLLRYLGHIEGIKETLESIGYKTMLVMDKKKYCVGPIEKFSMWSA